MEKQNVTLSLPKSLLREAKALASLDDKSLSQLMRESLEEKIRRSKGYEEAMDRQLRLMQSAFDLGIEDRVAVTREDLHDRR